MGKHVIDGKWDEDDATISHWMPLPEPPEAETALEGGGNNA